MQLEIQEKRHNYHEGTIFYKQYKLKYGADCKFAAQEHKDLWFCTCGALNHSGEKCHVCKKELIALKNVDLETLKAERDARLEAERQEALKPKESPKIAPTSQETPRVEKMVVKFGVEGTVEEIKALKKFLTDNNIKYFAV